MALALKSAIVDLPWMDQMFYTTLITMAIIAGVSMTSLEAPQDPKGILLKASLFQTGATFNISAYVILIILAVLYTIFW